MSEQSQDMLHAKSLYYYLIIYVGMQMRVDLKALMHIGEWVDRWQSLDLNKASSLSITP